MAVKNYEHHVDIVESYGKGFGIKNIFVSCFKIHSDST